MRSSLSLFLRITALTLIGFFDLINPTTYAQTNTLKLCAETFWGNREATIKTKVPNQLTLFPALDPTTQKLKQIQTNWEECVKGQKTPLLSWLPFKNLLNKSVDSTSLSGKIIVVNFWFTTCAPCVAEMPALNKLVDEYKGRNVVFLGFANDKADRLNPTYFAKHPFAFDIIADARAIANSFSVTGYPTTFIIDQQGIIQKAWIAYTADEMDVLAPYYKAKSAIDKLLTTNSR